MKTYQRALAYVAIALGLGGCDAQAPQQSSQLEQTVQAQGLPISGTPLHGRLVSPEPKVEELDLSTPEKAVTYMFDAIKEKNREKLKGVIAEGGRVDVEGVLKELKDMKDYNIVKSDGFMLDVDIVTERGLIKGAVEVSGTPRKYRIQEVAPRN